MLGQSTSVGHVGGAAGAGGAAAARGAPGADGAPADGAAGGGAALPGTPHNKSGRRSYVGKHKLVAQEELAAGNGAPGEPASCWPMSRADRAALRQRWKEEEMSPTIRRLERTAKKEVRPNGGGGGAREEEVRPNGGAACWCLNPQWESNPGCRGFMLVP